MQNKLKDLDGRIGEAFDGDSPNGSHINVVMSVRGSTSYGSTVATLSNPTPGHVPFLACLGLGNLVRPATVVINKITFDDKDYERYFYGAVQLGISQGVMDAVKECVIHKEDIDHIALLVACWIDPMANNETKIRINTREAMFNAIKNAVKEVSESDVDDILSIYESAVNNFYSGS